MGKVAAVLSLFATMTTLVGCGKSLEALRASSNIDLASVSPTPLASPSAHPSSTPSTSASQNCTTQDGQVVEQGSSVRLFSQALVSFGQSCPSQTVTCSNGALTPAGTYYSACSVAPAMSCTFNGQYVGNGQSVTAYFAASVPYGQTCQSQQRTCTNGSLSGNYIVSSCQVTAAANCQTPAGATVANGSSVTTYVAATVPYGQTCTSQTATCNNGQFQGAISANTSCQVSAAANCSLNGQTIANGQSVTAYASGSVAYGQTCQSQQRTCSNGSLSGTFGAVSCQVAPAANCVTPAGATIANGAGVTTYSVPTVAYGQTCSALSATCRL